MAVAPTVRIKNSYYFEAFQSTRPNDSVTFDCCRVLDSQQQQVCYNLNTSRPHDQPAHWRELPAFCERRSLFFVALFCPPGLTDVAWGRRDAPE